MNDTQYRDVNSIIEAIKKAPHKGAREVVEYLNVIGVRTRTGGPWNRGKLYNFIRKYCPGILVGGEPVTTASPPPPRPYDENQAREQATEHIMREIMRCRAIKLDRRVRLIRALFEDDAA